jgi:DNA-binding MarR family transcriptional regulator
VRHTLVFHTINLAKKLQKDIGFKSAPLSLSYSEASALLVIASQKTISQKEIAQTLRLEPASVVTLVDELEKLRLVKRLHSNGDRRKYQIILTEAGQSKAKLLKKRSYQLDHFLEKQLSPKEIQIFFPIVEKLTKSLDKWEGGDK